MGEKPFIPLKTLYRELDPGVEIEFKDRQTGAETTHILWLGEHHNWLATDGTRLCWGHNIRLTGRQFTVTQEMVSDLAIEKATRLGSFGWRLPDWLEDSQDDAP